MRVRQQSKHELAAALQVRYLKATKTAKGRLLDEFCAVTGYHRREHEERGSWPQALDRIVAEHDGAAPRA